MITPLIQVIAVLIVSNLLWALAIWQFGEDSPLAWVGQGFGMFYFPMALLGVVILGNLSGANPMRVIPSIVRTLPSYALVGAVAVALSFALSWMSERLSESDSIIVIMGATTALTLYFVTVHARLLGLFYRQESEKLDWL